MLPFQFIIEVMAPPAITIDAFIAIKLVVTHLQSMVGSNARLNMFLHGKMLHPSHPGVRCFRAEMMGLVEPLDFFVGNFLVGSS